MPTTNRVLIIEDVPQVADWLTQRLHEALGQRPVDLACSSAQANNLIKHNHYQLALVDLGLPDGNGVDLLPLIKNQSPQTQCIVTTIFDDAEHLFAALRAGADGYLLKDEEEQAFVAQLGGILQGKPPLSASIAGASWSSFVLPLLPRGRLDAKGEAIAATHRPRLECQGRRPGATHLPPHAPPAT
ncbi:response regulator transcription factor [Halopseudomonas pachastrellae]|nr:response regulator transcription factor [Halopseudomonas pachastrellae]